MAELESAELQNARQQLANAYGRETATTMKVLRAYPPGHDELRPHEKLKTARELVWMFTLEMALAEKALSGELDITAGFPPPPATLEEAISAFDQARGNMLKAIEESTDEQLSASSRFYTGPGEMGDVPNIDFLWFILSDQIHHRGQFSVYLRMADGKVPSIYGPSADEPWM